MPERPIRDVVNKGHFVAVAGSLAVRDATKQMAEHRTSAALVMADGKLAGIFTERDLLMRVVAAGLDPDKTTLAQVMTTEPDTIAADRPLKEAIRMMDEFCYRHLPVMEDGKVLGVLSLVNVPFGERANMQAELDERHNLAERML